MCSQNDKSQPSSRRTDIPKTCTSKLENQKRQFYLAKLVPTEIRNDRVVDSESVQIADDRRAALQVRVVCEQHSRILHQRRDVTRLASWGSAHVQHMKLYFQKVHHLHTKTRFQNVIYRNILDKMISPSFLLYIEQKE